MKTAEETKNVYKEPEVRGDNYETISLYFS